MALTASTSNAGFLGNCRSGGGGTSRRDGRGWRRVRHINAVGSGSGVYAEGLLAIHAAVPEMVIVIVAGNHDSASRLEIYRNLWRSHNVFVIGSLRRLADNSADYSAHVVPVPGKGYIAAVPYGPGALFLPPHPPPGGRRPPASVFSRLGEGCG